MQSSSFPSHKRKFDAVSSPVTGIEVRPELASLLLACSYNELEEVQDKLKDAQEKFGLSSRDLVNLVLDGCTSMHHACSRQDGWGTEIVRFLLCRGAMVDLRDGFGATALHYAASGGKVGLFSLLLRNNADPNIKTYLGDTVLHSVIGRSNTHGRLRIVGRLLDMHANPNQANSQGNTPTKLALMGGHVDLAYELMEAGGHRNTTDNQGLTMLHHLALKNLEETPGRPCICKVTHRLVRASFHPCNPEAKDKILGSTAMHLACSNDKGCLVHALLTLKAEVNSRNDLGETPLHRAILDCGSSNLVCLLLEKGANPLLQDNKLDTALHVACYEGRDGEVKTIVQAYPTSINARGRDGMTPLHVATKRGDIPLVRLLLQQNTLRSVEPSSLVNAQTTDGSTALHLACQSDNHKIAKLLLRQHPNFNIRRNNSWLPFHDGCAVGRTELLQAILGECEKRFRATNNGIGWFPSFPLPEIDLTAGLEVAAAENHKEVVWFLLQKFPTLALH